MRRPAIFISDGDGDGDGENNGSSGVIGSDGAISSSTTPVCMEPYDSSRAKKRSKYGEQDRLIDISDTMTNMEKVKTGIFIQRPFVRKDSLEAFHQSLLRNVFKNLLFIAYYDADVHSYIPIDKTQDIFGDIDNDIFNDFDKMANPKAMLLELSRLFLVHYEWTLISIRRNNTPLYSKRFKYLNEPFYLELSPFEGDIRAKLAMSGNKGLLFQIYDYLYKQLTHRSDKALSAKKYEFARVVDNTFRTHFFKTISVLGKIFQHSAESFAKSALEIIKPGEAPYVRLRKIRQLQKEGKSIPKRLQKWMAQYEEASMTDRPKTLEDLPRELIFEILSYARPKYISVLEFMDMIHIALDIDQLRPKKGSFLLVLSPRHPFVSDFQNEKKLYFVYNRGDDVKVPARRKTGLNYGEDPSHYHLLSTRVDMSPLLDVYSFLVALIYVIKLFMINPDTVSYHPTSAIPDGDGNETVRLVDTSWYPRAMSEINHDSLMKIGKLFVDHSNMVYKSQRQVSKRQII